MAERPKIRNYRDLEVWQRGMDIALLVYQVGDKGVPARRTIGIDQPTSPRIRFRAGKHR